MLDFRNSHSGLGKYCIISHRLSKMLLTSVQDGVALTLGKIDADGHYDSSQLWNVNDISCTIQSVADKKCLAVNENGMLYALSKDLHIAVSQIQVRNYYFNYKFMFTLYNYFRRRLNSHLNSEWNW